MKDYQFITGGIKKTSLLDYPDKISALIFTQGCNFNCGYCHNPMLLRHNENTLNINDIFAFLETRKGKLDGIVITGGEPCMQKDLKQIVTKIKEMGFCVKLDTNGSYPNVLNDLLKNNLLDYIAMDIKAPLEKYCSVINAEIDAGKIKKSIDLIMHSSVDYEFRTTFMPFYHAIDDFEKIGALIKGAKKYYLQKFEARTEINNPALKNEKNYSDENIAEIVKILTRYIQNVFIR